MNKDYIWDDYYKDYGNALTFNKKKEYFNYIENSDNNPYIIVKNTYETNYKCNMFFDEISRKKNSDLVYTDKKHPIVLFELNNKNKLTFINDMYFYMYQDKFVINEQKNIENIISKNELPKVLVINSTVLDSNFINYLNENASKLKNTTLIINSVSTNVFDLDEKVSELKNIRYQITYLDNNKLLNKYTYLDIFTLKKFVITMPVDNEDFVPLQYSDQNALINLQRSEIYDEESYFNDLKNVFKLLSKYNHHFNITITVDNRRIFNESKLLEELPSNINLRIKNYDSEYKVSEYKENDNQINEFVKYIKDSNLSQFEKFMEANRFVSNFKKYTKVKSNARNKSNRSRDLKYILNNKYIVCKGYAELLNAILDELNIPCTSYHTASNIIDDKNNIENKTGHRRNIVKIDDDKYNIHGIYLTDATYNNTLGENTNTCSIFTFDELKGKYKIESLQEEDLLLDFHNKEEFYRKINYYLSKFVFTKNEVGAYTKLYKKILIILERLDYDKYKYFYDKYSIYFNENISKEKLYKELVSMLEEYYDYMLPLLNKKVEYEKISKAIEINDETFRGKSLNEEEKEVKFVNDLNKSLRMFPVEYNEERDALEIREVELELYKDNEFIESVVVHNKHEFSIVQLTAGINGYEIKINDNKKSKKL